MKIGSVVLEGNVFLAPMAGVTDYPFRALVRKFGCPLAYTEMLSASGVVNGSERTFFAVEEDDRPIGVQIFGSCPVVMSEAAQVLENMGADIIDINMGCPARKVVSAGAGAALLRDLRRAEKIIQEVRKKIKVPLTIKIRSGWNHEEICVVEISRMAAANGVDAIIVHPRTAVMGFSGRADWGLIREVKNAVKIPVIGNGDVRTLSDMERMISETGCDGVMIGRGALGRPWIFAHLLRRCGSEFWTLNDRLPIINHHVQKIMEVEPNRYLWRNFRKHLLWYTKGLPGSARLRNELSRIDDVEVLKEKLYILFTESHSRFTFNI
ncbi:MAG: tRNA dihydrouridine synthase DusB [Syntrophales bacterium]|nr:tRNA dihydrouridine synthase DusB [Syntrophales bacterium]